MTRDDFRRMCDAIEGYTTLGLLDESLALLDSLPAQLKVSKEAITLHMGILVKAGEYLKASYLAETLSLSEPDNIDRILMVARYRYMAGAIEDALPWLHPVAKKCKGDAYFHYLTAQCQAALGDLEQAKASLKAAFELNGELRHGALDDPVFESVFG